MKVLDNNDYIKKTCPYCKSVLGIMYGDIHVGIAEELYVICAVCGQSIELRYDEIPNRWRCALFADYD